MLRRKKVPKDRKIDSLSKVTGDDTLDTSVQGRVDYEVAGNGQVTTCG
jgi:hypothetical protein